MAHKTLIEGTEYSIIGGKTLAGGTGYTIAKGKTVVGGTGYDIPFSRIGFDEVIADMNILYKSQKNGSMASNLFSGIIFDADTTFYVLQFFNGYLAIVKVFAEYRYSQAPGITKQVLALTDGDANYQPYFTGEVSSIVRNLVRAYVSINGGTSAYGNLYGGTILIVNFPNTPEAVVDRALSSVTLTRGAGRNLSSMGTVTMQNVPASARLFVSVPSNSNYSLTALNSPIGTVKYTSNPSALNPSGIAQIQTNTGLSSDGSTFDRLYGGTIVQVS